jgi:hypothetical protein
LDIEKLGAMASAQCKAEIKPARKGALIHCILPKQEVRDHSLLEGNLDRSCVAALGRAKAYFRGPRRRHQRVKENLQVYAARLGASVATVEPNLHRVTTIESRAKPTFVDAIPKINVLPRRLQDDDE